jgi:mTERF domain-containing protein
MKLLSVKDEDFVVRASKSIAEFEAYKEEMVPIFAAQTAREKTLREVSNSAEQQRMLLERKRIEFIRTTHEETVRKREYSERVAKARQSLRLLKGRSQHRSR